MAAPDDPLTIVPRTDVAVMGLVGGPFRPIRCGFVLGNAGGAPLTWSVEVEGTWLHLDGPSEGVLPPHGSLALRLDVVSEEAAKLPAGRHSARLRFRMGDDDDLAGVREVLLDAVPPAEGWTEFSPSPDTRTIYVSSSTGDDANGGFSEDAAKRTIAAGKALLRHGFPDWLLLRRGDVWEESLGQWKMSGRSPTEPMLVATYGDDDTRPLLRTGTRGGIWTHGGGRSPPTIDNLAIVGLHFHADDRDGTENSKGARMLQPGAHVLFEDCMFEAFHTNVVFQGKSDERLVDYRLRRSVIVDAYAVHDGGHPQGLYADEVDGLLIEENHHRQRCVPRDAASQRRGGRGQPLRAQQHRTARRRERPHIGQPDGRGARQRGARRQGHRAGPSARLGPQSPERHGSRDGQHHRAQRPGRIAARPGGDG
ncbi:MAG: hypothetical protein ACYTG2_07945 [Planctomycetota bacterium]